MNFAKYSVQYVNLEGSVELGATGQLSTVFLFCASIFPFRCVSVSASSV